MSHSQVHFWEHSPPRSGETQSQWLARRLSDDARRGVTSIFPPGVTQEQVRARAGGAKLTARSEGQNAVYQGKILLEYAGSGGKSRQGYFEVKLVVCRTQCSPNRPGDVISIIQLSGPGVIRGE